MFGKPCFQTFPNFSKLFQNFSKLFDLKTGFFDSKTQTLRSFFFNLRNWHTISVNILTFFRTFLRKFCELENSSFFQKNSELWQLNISQTRINEKFGKFHLTQGLNVTFTAISHNDVWKRNKMKIVFKIQKSHVLHELFIYNLDFSQLSSLRYNHRALFLAMKERFLVTAVITRDYCIVYEKAFW